MSFWQTCSQRRRIGAVAGLVFLGLVLVPYWASPLSPVAVRQSPAVPAKHTVETGFDEIGLDMPYLEAVDVRPDGRVIFGTEMGFVLDLPASALQSDRGQVPQPRQIAEIGGHSIGITYDPVTDVYWSATFPIGLQRIDPEGSVRTIDTVEGAQVTFPDDVAIGPDGIIYMTEASTKYTPVTTAPEAPYVLWDFIEGRANGRLIAYDPSTGIAETALNTLAFPSGITLSPDRTAMLIVEVTRYRVLRYELAGPHMGTVSVLADGLPGIPDDVFVGPAGHVWVTLVAPRSGIVEDVVGRTPYLARLISILPWSWQNAMLAQSKTGGSLLMLDEDGVPTCELRLSHGYPPANGVILGDRFLLGRLGGHELMMVDPSECLNTEDAVRSRSKVPGTQPWERTKSPFR